jgi:hypothetical protein
MSSLRRGKEEEKSWKGVSEREGVDEDESSE